MLVNCVIGYVIKCESSKKLQAQLEALGPIQTGVANSRALAFVGVAGATDYSARNGERLRTIPSSATGFVFQDVTLEMMDIIQISKTESVAILALHIDNSDEIMRIDQLRRPNTVAVRKAFKRLGLSLSESNSTYAITASSSFDGKLKTQDGWLVGNSATDMNFIGIGINVELVLQVTAERYFLDYVANEIALGQISYRKSRRALCQLDLWLTVLSSDSTELLNAHRQLRDSLALDSRREDVLASLRHLDKQAELRTASSLGIAATIGTVLSSASITWFSGWFTVITSVIAGFVTYLIQGSSRNLR